MIYTADEKDLFTQFNEALQPIKRGPGRPPGAKNKATIEREKQLAKQNGQQKQPKKGKNALEAEFTMKVLAIADGVDHSDIEDMKHRFIQYLRLCRDSDHKIGNLGAYAAVGLDAKTAQTWLTPEFRRRSPEKSDLVEAINKICALYRESLIASGSIDKITGIFWQKALDGLRDDSPTQNYVNQTPDEGKTPEAIAQKYKTLPKA